MSTTAANRHGPLDIRDFGMMSLGCPQSRFHAPGTAFLLWASFFGHIYNIACDKLLETLSNFENSGNSVGERFVLDDLLRILFGRRPGSYCYTGLNFSDFS